MLNGMAEDPGSGAATIAIPSVDRHVLFQAAPALILVIAPDAPRYTLIDATDAYLHATLCERHQIIGRPLFEVCPDSPDDSKADGTVNLRASLERAISTGRADAMPDQKYDVANPDGVFEQRW